VSDYTQFSKFHTQNGEDTLPRFWTDLRRENVLAATGIRIAFHPDLSLVPVPVTTIVAKHSLSIIYNISSSTTVSFLVNRFVTPGLFLTDSELRV